MKKIILAIFTLIFNVSLLLGQNYKLPQIIINTNNINISNDYIKGSISIIDTDSAIITLNAKFKIRGATSSHYTTKPSLALKLRDENGESLDSSLLEMRSCSKWILDAMAIDRICMRNRIAMDIWNDYSSLPYVTSFPIINSEGKIIYRSGTIGKYVEVIINNIYKGVYVLSDHINRKLLDLKKVAEKKNTDNDTIRGVLYKSGTSDISNQNIPVFSDDYKTCVVKWHNAWELKEPEDYECQDAWNPLLNAIGSTLANNKEIKVDTYELVKKYFYIDNLVDYQLHIMALSITDNWGNKNHYFSIRNIQKDINDIDINEANKRKFFISPWDLDTSLGGDYAGRYYDGNYGQDWTPENIVKNGGFFPFNICQGNEEYKKLLQIRWKEIRKTTFNPLNINKRLETYCNLLIYSGAWERNEEVHPCYIKDLVKEINYIKVWYINRFKMLDDYFGVTDDINKINDINLKNNIETIYTLDGRKSNIYIKGINIVKMSNGKYKKIYK